MMPNTFEFLDSIDDRITAHVAKFQEYQAEDLGLDRRSAYRLYVDADHTCIAVSKTQDRTLQYYGGFEYIDKDHRKEMGSWVFYFAESDRVADALEHLEESPFLEADDDNALQEDF
jgi:hypothetical protein